MSKDDIIVKRVAYNKEGLYNKDGELISNLYYYIPNYNIKDLDGNRYFIACEECNSIFVNLDTKEEIFKAETITPYYGKYLVAVTGYNSKELFDFKGNKLLKDSYYYISPNNNDTIIIGDYTECNYDHNYYIKKGLISLDGKVILEKKYNDIIYIDDDNYLIKSFKKRENHNTTYEYFIFNIKSCSYKYIGKEESKFENYDYIIFNNHIIFRNLRVDNSYMVNLNGEIIKLSYFIFSVNHALNILIIKDKKTGKVGMLDKDLNIIFPCEYNYIEDFNNEGYAVASKTVDKETKYGIIKIDGTIAFPFILEYLTSYDL